MTGRRWRPGLAVGVTVAAGVLGACAQNGPHSVSDLSNPSSASAIARVDPTHLVGMWFVHAPGQAPGSVLRLGDDASLLSACGELDGAWMADTEGLLRRH